MVERIDIEELVERYLGQRDLAAPTLDPRTDLIDELFELFERENPCNN